MKPVIVNCGIGAWYPRGQARLKESLDKQGYTGDTLFYTNLPHNWPSHRQVPYHFKTYENITIYPIEGGGGPAFWFKSHPQTTTPSKEGAAAMAADASSRQPRPKQVDDKPAAAPKQSKTPKSAT